jgi:hypothetical protein
MQLRAGCHALGEEANRRSKLHWATVGLERLRSGASHPGASFSYNLLPVSQRDFERIRRLHIDYYERVRELVPNRTARISPDDRAGLRVGRMRKLDRSDTRQKKGWISTTPESSRRSIDDNARWLSSPSGVVASGKAPRFAVGYRR